MKKLLLFIVTTLFASNLFAQDFQNNIFGVRAGVNFSTFNTSLDLDHRTGIHAGFSYEQLLTRDLPLYLETGLHYSGKGFKNTSSVDYNSEYGHIYSETQKTSLHYLQIPLMINYKFSIGDSFAIYPSAGFYYAFAVAGNEKYTEYTKEGEAVHESVYDIFDGEFDVYKPSDFGYRITLTFAYERYVLSAGYEGGIVGLSSSVEEFGLKITNSNIFLSLGVNF